MKKSVGIITIHYVDNLGGVLLAYALQSAVQRLGYSCDIIDYDPTEIPSLSAHLSKGITHRLAKLPYYIRHFSRYAKLLFHKRELILPPRHLHSSTGLRKKRFDDFRSQHISLGQKPYTSFIELENAPPLYDAYICGSDQIWNPYICKKPGEIKNDPAYFLRFAPQTKRISYAPSIAIPEIPPGLRTEMGKMLAEIPFLSCREQQGAAIIKELCGREAKLVLDPTLLLAGSSWSGLAKPPEISTPYILGYFLSNDTASRDAARALSLKTGYALAMISNNLKDFDNPQTINCSDAGPAEFLGLVNGAQCVCTDSFHGTIFSINFEKPFYVFERSGSDGAQSMASRIHSILEICGLSDRLIKPNSIIPGHILPVDYMQINRILIKLRSESLQYLSNALERTTRTHSLAESDE